MRKFLVFGLLLTACGSEEESNDPSKCLGYCTVDVSVNPLDLTVDGESYVDSEVWYTNQLEKIEMEASEKYPDLNVKITGSIGLTDLAKGLTYFVYNNNISKQQSYGFVLLDGSFRSQQFNVLTVKRVNIELVDNKNQAQHTWCFNFKGTSSFVADQKSFTNVKDWTTSLTKYKCASVDGRTFGLPQ